MRLSARARVLLPGAVGLWLLLTDASLASWVIGAPTILAVLWYANHSDGQGGAAVSLRGALRFLPFFLRESMRGGIDVAGRVLAPRLRVDPGFVTYATALKQPAARVLFANSVSLLPGTLAADLDGQALRVHALDVTGDFRSELRRVEVAIGRIFGETL